MKKLLAIMAAAAAFAFAVYAASPAATQAWVIKYCADHGMTTSESATGSSYTYGSGTDAVTMTVSRPSALALVATNCSQGATQGGITNGMTFAYHKPYAVFLNEPAQKRIWIDVNPTSLSRTYVCGSWTGRVYAAQMWLTDAQTNKVFRVYGTRIQAAEAHSLTNGFNGGGL